MKSLSRCCLLSCLLFLAPLGASAETVPTKPAAPVNRKKVVILQPEIIRSAPAAKTSAQSAKAKTPAVKPAASAATVTTTAARTTAPVVRTAPKPASVSPLAEGKKLFARKDYAGARKQFEAILLNAGDQQPKVTAAAKLWLAKSLYMLDLPADAETQLDQLLKSSSRADRDPAMIYEAHFDLASCRLRLGQTLPAALDYLNVGVSAGPAGTERIRQTALGNARLIASAMLEADEIAALERVAKTPDLQAFLLNERMQKYLRSGNLAAFRSTLPLAQTLASSPALAAFYRELLQSLAAQEKALNEKSWKEYRIGILLPLEFPVYLQTSSLPAGNRVYQGLHTCLLKHQVVQPDVLLNTAVGSTTADTGNTATPATERLIEKHRPIVILGPLFSGEAVESAKAAKHAKVPLITPTATDKAISSGNQWGFQLNPTHEERGRIAARELLKTSKPAIAAALAEKSPYLEEMAKGFLDELMRNGTETVIFASVDNGTETNAATAQALNALSGKTLDALYLPMDDPDLVDRTLSLLSTSKTDYRRLLGSGIWNDSGIISRFKTRLPKGITFFSDYHTAASGGTLAETAKNNSLIWNVPPSPYLWYGYDSLDYLLKLLSIKPVRDGKALARALREAPVFKAHYTSYYFSGGNVNRSMNVLHYENNTIKSLP